MALTLFTNTFLVDADPYNNMDADWNQATDLVKEKALIDATNYLNDMRWLGSALEVTQPLSWPRSTFSYYDPSMNLVVEVTENTVPERLRRAVANLALHFVKYPSITEDRYASDYEEIEVGPIKLKNTSATGKSDLPPVIPHDRVLMVIKPILSYNDFSHNTTWWRVN